MIHLAAQLDDEALPQTIYFNSTDCGIRPLWTYVLERRGVEIAVIHYSHSVQASYVPGRPDIWLYTRYYEIQNWPHHIVMSEHHKRVVQDMGGAPAEFFIAGPIGWRDSTEPTPRIEERAVAILDTTPPRSILSAVNGWPALYQKRSVVESFYRKTLAAVERAGLRPLVKTKTFVLPEEVDEESGSLYAQSHIFRQLFRDSDAVQVNKEVSVHRAIEDCEAVIAIPFSTSGEIARTLGKPVVYFDPTGELAGFEKHTGGAPLILTERDLDLWLAEVTGNADHTGACRKLGAN